MNNLLVKLSVAKTLMPKKESENYEDDDYDSINFKDKYGHKVIFLIDDNITIKSIND